MNELSALPNPFRDTVVQDAWQSPVDISEIHAAAFDACRAGIESASRAVPGSLLIYGSAGSGKTHLLSRLQRHLAETARNAPDKVLHCVFCFVRLQTSPLLLWQHVRRRLATDLMRREQGLTQLQRLVGHQLGIGWGRTARAGILELRVLRSEDEAALTQHLRELGMKLDLPRNLSIVLEELVFNRNVRDASAWLAGDGLPESALEALDLAQRTTKIARRPRDTSPPRCADWPAKLYPSSFVSTRSNRSNEPQPTKRLCFDSVEWRRTCTTLITMSSSSRVSNPHSSTSSESRFVQLTSIASLDGASCSNR